MQFTTEKPTSIYLETYSAEQAKTITALRNLHWPTLQKYTFSWEEPLQHIVTIPSLRTEREPLPNGIELLAIQLAQENNCPFHFRLLKKNKVQQRTLKREARLQSKLNLTFRRPPPFLARERILILDDVRTTGATLRKCKQLFHKHGFCNLRFFTLFYQPRC